MRSIFSGSSSWPKSDGRPLHRPQLAALLVHADDEPAALLAQIALPGGIHAVGQLGVALVDLGEIVGDEVLVLHRVARQIDARHFAHLPRPQAGGVDDVLGVHRALHGRHIPGSVGPRAKLVHGVAEHDLRALHARALRVRLGGARRVEVAVERIVERPEQSLRIRDRRESGDLLGPDDLGLESHVAVLGALGLEEVEPVRVCREGESPDVVQPAGLAGELLQLAIEADGVALQRGHVGVRVQGVEAARRVPGRARGQLGALDEHHVAPAEAGEVIEHAAPDHPAADHRDPDVGFHDCDPGRQVQHIETAASTDTTVRFGCSPPIDSSILRHGFRFGTAASPSRSSSLRTRYRDDNRRGKHSVRT